MNFLVFLREIITLIKGSDKTEDEKMSLLKHIDYIINIVDKNEVKSREEQVKKTVR